MCTLRLAEAPTLRDREGCDRKEGENESVASIKELDIYLFQRTKPARRLALAAGRSIDLAREAMAKGRGRKARSKEAGKRRFDLKRSV